MVLAHAGERDVAGEDQLVIALVVAERGQGELSRGEELRIGLRHATRRIGQTLLADVEAKCREERGGGVLRRDQVHAADRGSNLQMRTRGVARAAARRW